MARHRWLLVSFFAMACSRPTAEVRTTGSKLLHVGNGPVAGSEFTAVRVRLDHVTLAVVDTKTSGTFRDIFLSSKDILFAINGGYFEADDAPIGEVRSEGHELSPFAPRPGGIFVAEAAHAALFDAEQGARSEPFALQASPRLVVNRGPNLRGDSGKRADRTGLCILSSGTEIEVVITRGTTGVTLTEFADLLRSRGCEEALNLDGGPSTALAYRDGERTFVSPPRGPVRHVVVGRR